MSRWMTVVAGGALVWVLGVPMAGPQDVKQDTHDIRQDRQDFRQDTRDIRSDLRDLREDRQELRQAIKNGDTEAAKQARRRLRY